MPQAVIPFPMNTKSFLMTILAVMVMMRLFLMLLGAIPFWLRKIDSSSKAEPMDGTELTVSRFEKFWRFVLKRKRKHPDDIEMSDAGVQGG